MGGGWLELEFYRGCIKPCSQATPNSTLSGSGLRTRLRAMYHNFGNEDFRNAAQRGFGNRYFRNRYRLDENTLLLTFDP